MTRFFALLGLVSSSSLLHEPESVSPENVKCGKAGEADGLVGRDIDEFGVRGDEEPAAKLSRQGADPLYSSSRSGVPEGEAMDEQSTGAKAFEWVSASVNKLMS